MRRAWLGGILGLMCLLLATPGWAQPSRPDGSTFSAGVTAVTPLGALYSTAPPVITDGGVGLPRMDANRNLQINCLNCGGAAGGTSATDKTNFTGGTSSFTPVGGAFDDVATSTLAEGQYGIMRLTSFRAIHVNIRDNAGNEVTSFGGGGGVSVNEDSVAADLAAGTPAYAVRSDTLATTTSASGDWTWLKSDATGALWVNCSTGCSGGTQYDESTVHVSGDKLTLAGVVRNDAAVALANNGERTVLSVDDTGRLWTTSNTELPSALLLSDTTPNPTTPPVGAMMMAYNTGTGQWFRWPGTTQYAEDSAAADGQLGSLVLAVRRDTAASSTVTNGDYGTLNTDASGALWVNCLTGCAASSGTVGAVAHDAVGTGSFPLLMGGYASAAAPADVSADGDAVRAWFLRNGAQAVHCASGCSGSGFADEAVFTLGTTPISPVGGLYLSSRDTVVSGRAAALAMSATRALITTPEGPAGEVLVDAANSAMRSTIVTVVTTQPKTQIIREWHFTASQPGTTALVTVAGGTKMRVLHAMVTCSNANTVNVGARLGFGASGVAATSSTTGALGVILSHPGIAPGAGVATNFTGAIEGADGEDPYIELGAPTTGSCRLVMAYEVI